MEQRKGLDNQQERLEQMDAGSYLGGLITGEGHFGLVVRKTKAGLQVNPHFSLSMADEDTVSFAADSLKGLGLSVYVDAWGARQGQKRPQYRIVADGHKRVRRYCESLIPYLTGDKKRSAEIVLRFIESRLDRPRGQGVKAPYTEDEIALVNELRVLHDRPDLIKNHL